MQTMVIDITGGIKSAIAALQSGQINKVIGRDVVRAVRQHFITLNADRHHPWAQSPGFYASAAANTSMEVVEDGVEVTTNKTGLGLRIHGGTVTPGKNPSSVGGGLTKYLAIPALAISYGRKPAEFGNLQFVRFGKGPNAPAALIEKTPKGVVWSASGKKVRNVIKQGKSQGSFGRRVLFWLILSATHPPDLSVEPNMDDLENVAFEAAKNYLEKAIW